MSQSSSVKALALTNYVTQSQVFLACHSSLLTVDQNKVVLGKDFSEVYDILKTSDSEIDGKRSLNYGVSKIGKSTPFSSPSM